MTIHAFSKPFVGIDGVPVLERVDTAIFRHRYFTDCMRCGFCHDRCCRYGVDVDAVHHVRIMARADQLEPFVGVPRSEWFTGEWLEDPEVPGGRTTRTSVRAGSCVFLNRNGRGCLLHGFATTNGLDYHLLKPMLSSLFPLTFEWGLLRPSTEIVERDLICLDQGPTLYRGTRNELLHYFGSALVDELDAIERDEHA